MWNQMGTAIKSADLAFPRFGVSKSGVAEPVLCCWGFTTLTQVFPEMCWVSSLSTFQSGGGERGKPQRGGGGGCMIALQWVPSGEVVGGIVHLWIKCNKEKQNLNPISLFLLPSLHTFHSLLFMLLFFFFNICIHPCPFVLPWDTVLCTVCSWAPHTAHPFFLQSGWRPSGRAHYFTIFAFTKPEAPPFKQCTP